MSIIKNAEYTPFEAYTFLCNKIETEHSEYFYYLGFPYPRFSIINGLYFFLFASMTNYLAYIKAGNLINILELIDLYINHICAYILIVIPILENM